jgi:macrolide-specific efflux system membrane fusion protein
VGEQLSSSGTGGTSTSGSGSGSGQSNNSLGNGSRGGTGSSSSSSSSSTGEIQVISTGQFTVQLGISDLDVKNLAAGQAATITLSSATNSGNGRGFGGFGGGGGFAQRLANGGGGGGGGTGASGASGTSGASAALAAVAPASGTVTSVGRVATASSGVASYPVVVSFSTTTGEFNPGATASVSIVYNQIADAIQVPTRAVTFSGGQSTVTVSNNGKRSTRTVTTGITSGGMIQITSGLSDGEEVVVSTPTVTGGGNGTGSGGRLNGASGFPGGAGGAGGATNGKPVIVDGGGG